MKKIFLILVAFVFLFSFVSAVCGNGTCEGGETKCNCASDCGKCEGAVPNQLCQQYSCATGDCLATVVYNCCGNNICEASENYGNCASDCAPKSVSIEVIDFDEAKKFRLGEPIKFEVRVKADNVTVRSANVKAIGFFGTMQLYDDATHGDKLTSDGVYTNEFLISEGILKAEYVVTITAEKLGASATKELNVIVDPSLDLNVFFDKPNYMLGEIIDLNGSFSKDGNGLSKVLTVKAQRENVTIFQSDVNSDVNGFFSFSYHSSLIEPIGNWLFSVSGKDEYGNTGLFEEKVLFTDAKHTAFLDLNFLSPSPGSIIVRNDQLTILVDVSFDGSPMDNAEVDAIFPNGFVSRLKQLTGVPGRYRTTYLVPDNFPLGEQRIVLNAKNKIETINYSGSGQINAIIEEVPIEIELVEPSRTIFAVGEEIPFRVNLFYSTRQPVISADVFLLVGQEEIKFEEKEEGVYYASYVVSPNDLTGLNFSVKATDKYANTGFKELDVEVRSQLSLEFYLRNEPLIFLTVVVIAFLLIVLFILFRRRMHSARVLEKKRNELKKLIEALQQRYFNQRTISSEEFYDLLNKYEEELRNVEAAIEAMKGKKEAIEIAQKEKDSFVEESEGLLLKVKEKPLQKKPLQTDLDKKPRKSFLGILMGPAEKEKKGKK